MDRGHDDLLMRDVGHRKLGWKGRSVVSDSLEGVHPLVEVEVGHRICLSAQAIRQKGLLTTQYSPVLEVLGVV